MSMLLFKFTSSLTEAGLPSDLALPCQHAGGPASWACCQEPGGRALALRACLLLGLPPLESPCFLSSLWPRLCCLTSD